MVEERDLFAENGWKVCDRSSPTIGPADFVGREWLRDDTFPPKKAGRSTTVPDLQSNRLIL
jgi:hypothetical protein